jgi:hypothetical protein
MHELRDPSADIKRIHHKPLTMDQRRGYRFDCVSSVNAPAGPRLRNACSTRSDSRKIDIDGKSCLWLLAVAGEGAINT